MKVREMSRRSRKHCVYVFDNGWCLSLTFVQNSDLSKPVTTWYAAAFSQRDHRAILACDIPDSISPQAAEFYVRFRKAAQFSDYADYFSAIIDYLSPGVEEEPQGMTDAMMKFGKEASRWRLMLNKSVEHVASRLGVSEGVVGKFERGLLKVEDYLKLVRAYDSVFGDVFGLLQFDSSLHHSCQTCGTAVEFMPWQWLGRRWVTNALCACGAAMTAFSCID